MQVQIWNSFSCNNSSDYRLVARFRDPSVARQIGNELRQFFDAYGEEFDDALTKKNFKVSRDTVPTAVALAAKYNFAWDARKILSWGDEGLTGDVPDVEVVGATLAVYHSYCGGFTDNIVQFLTAAGAEVEPEKRCPPDLSVRFVLPTGEAGERMATELATFLNQGAVKEYMHEFEPPPWGGERLDGDASSIRWYRDGQRFGFKMPFPPRGIGDLKHYLANVTELDMRLCDLEELAWFDMREPLAELAARIDAGERIEELDLSDKRLRFVPPRIFELTTLRRLVLDDNMLRTISGDIARLIALEELSLRDCGLEALPVELAALTNLRVLDISRNPLHALPPVLAKLPALHVLRASMLRDADLTGLAQMPDLEELDLSYLTRADKGHVEFPRAILGLRKLRSLNLSYAALGDVPDAITELRELESLHLDSAIGCLERLPPLRQLPKLRSLHISGNAGNTGHYPAHTLLDEVWEITTLEDLGIDRYGGSQKDGRTPLTRLWAHAFAKLTELRTLDLSFNDIATLPGSFYKLTKLESVDLQYTKLDRETLERLRTTFPRVKLDLRNVKTRFDVDDPHWKAVNAKVKSGSQKAAKRDREGAVADFEAALALCKPGSVYSDYDELYALYGAVDALGHLRLAVQGAERDAMTDKIIRYASRALELVPAPGSIWHFTNEGAFQEEVTRRGGNALAWMLMERGELDRALAVAERALSVGGDRGYIFDTKVRILLKMGREREAYAIADTILTEDPSFADFQDIKASPAFKAWQTAGRPRA